MKIDLTEKEIKLLMSILKDAQSERSSMGCNDAYKSEENMFTLEERQAMVRVAMSPNDWRKEDIEDSAEGGYMPNFMYVTYMINKIKEQIQQL